MRRALIEMDLAGGAACIKILLRAIAGDAETHIINGTRMQCVQHRSGRIIEARQPGLNQGQDRQR